MERCQAGLDLKICLVYLDDVIMFGSTFHETLRRLEIVLKGLGDFGLKLKASKCKLFHIELAYLGHTVSALGVSLDPDKIKALQELQTYLGFAGYYCSFMEGFAQIAKPLHQLVPSSQRNILQKKKKVPVGTPLSTSF